jgi:hypothetical protein
MELCLTISERRNTGQSSFSADSVVASAFVDLIWQSAAATIAGRNQLGDPDPALVFESFLLLKLLKQARFWPKGDLR